LKGRHFEIRKIKKDCLGMNTWVKLLEANKVTLSGDSFSARVLEEMAKQDENLRYNAQTQSLEMNIEFDVNLNLPQCFKKKRGGFIKC
jgi:hypothetical protein